MKKIFILVLLICPIFSYGASNVSMTTYYPVPSAIYSEVKADTASLSSADSAVLQIGSSSNTAVLDVTGSGTFSETLTIGNSTNNIYVQISEDLSVNNTSANTGTYNVLVQDDGGISVGGTTTDFSGSVAYANVGTDSGFFYDDLDVATASVTDEISMIGGDTEVSGTFTASTVGRVYSFAFRTTDTVVGDGYEDLPKFPDIPSASDCEGSTDPDMEWATWEYQDGSSVDQTLTVLALDDICSPAGGGGSVAVEPEGEEEE